MKLLKFLDRNSDCTAPVSFYIVYTSTLSSLSTRRDLLKGRERPYPNDNYLSGDGKSMVWNGHGYYVPHNRSWKKHHEVRALPNARIPDLIEFQNEDDWREWQKKRDTPGSGRYCASSGELIYLLCVI